MFWNYQDQKLQITCKDMVRYREGFLLPYYCSLSSAVVHCAQVLLAHLPVIFLWWCVSPDKYGDEENFTRLYTAGLTCGLTPVPMTCNGNK